MWRSFFFTLLSHTLTPLSRFRFIDLDPAAVLVPVAFMLYFLSFQMTFFAPPDQVDQLTYAVEIGKSILPYFEQYYSIKYPLPKAGVYLTDMNFIYYLLYIIYY